MAIVPPHIDETGAFPRLVDEMRGAYRFVENVQELANLVSRHLESVGESVDEELLIWKVLASIKVVDIGDVRCRQDGLLQRGHAVVFGLRGNRPPRALCRRDLAAIGGFQEPYFFAELASVRKLPPTPVPPW
jgi:hypothetical protein